MLRISLMRSTPPRSEQLLPEPSTSIRSSTLLMSLASFSHFPERVFRHTVGCLPPLPHNCLSRLTAQPNPDEARENREATGRAEGGEPKADGHGSAANRPPCQTQKTTRHSFELISSQFIQNEQKTTTRTEATFLSNEVTVVVCRCSQKLNARAPQPTRKASVSVQCNPFCCLFCKLAVLSFPCSGCLSVRTLFVCRFALIQDQSLLQMIDAPLPSVGSSSSLLRNLAS